jgi:hypothetical protein
MSESEQIGSGQKYKTVHPDYAGHSTETFSFWLVTPYLCSVCRCVCNILCTIIRVMLAYRSVTERFSY